MKLVLNDGKEFLGKSFGYPINISGEVVFNTSMFGYVEVLTDPSYYGQIVVLTYPLQGNYGVPSTLLESGRIQASGLIISKLAEAPHHFKKTKTLREWLYSHKIPALFETDTRALTQYLRSNSTRRGTLITEPSNSFDHIEKNSHYNFNYGMEETLYPNKERVVLVIDTGCKENIIRSLWTREATIIRIPWWKDWEKFLPECHGILISNGPGNPENYKSLVPRIKKLFHQRKPVLGICLGHQLLALAAGATIKKMTYGHRSINQPVRDERTKRCFITSQNHGYMVVEDTLSSPWRPWFTNLNDGSNEGLYHKDKLIRSVQFHPEASPGPNDTAFIFDDFLADLNRVELSSGCPSKAQTISRQIHEIEPRI